MKTKIIILFVALGSIFSCNPKQSNKEIGLQLYSIRDSLKLNLNQSIEKIGKIGYKYVETAGYEDGKIHGMKPENFKKEVEKHGMKVLSAHVGRFLPSPEEYEEAMSWWDKAIDTHLKAGAKYIVAPCMGEDGYKSLKVLKEYCDYYNEIGEMCNKKGVKFGYHNHYQEFAKVEDEIIYDFMLKNTDPNKVFFELDLFWIIIGKADPVEYFDKYPKRFELWHIKDKEEVGASGLVDFKRIFDNKNKSGMKFYFVEVEGSKKFDQIQSVKISFDYLNNSDFVK